MSLDWVVEPVADDAPCGPDLNALMDSAYDDYYFGALGRLPEKFIRPGVERPDGSRSPDTTLDPKDIDAATETKQIDALLQRSRDIRLLVLRAQWNILAGRILPMAQSVQAIADLLDTFGDDVHPSLADGPSERRDALNDLATQGSVLLPLQFTGLTGTSEVTLRKMKVANGQVAPLSFEDEQSASMLSDSLANPANRKKVDEIHGALATLSQALARIVSTCQMHETHPFVPALEPLEALVAECLGCITDARSDLRGMDVEVAPAAPQQADTDAAPTADTPAAAALPATDVTSHAHARQLLMASEGYYHQSEPSSATLLLVTQARLLIGKPLIEAIETLLPGEASKAVVEFGPQTGFAMNIDRLRHLSSEAAGTQAPQDNADDTPLPQFESAAEALEAIRSVEAYFRTREKSSPVPLLLQRARSYADKDFRALVEDLIPQPRTTGGE